MSLPVHRIDIVSDVVCPWCVIGYKRMERAMEAFADRLAFEVHWHPFQLNPHMPPEGQNLREHLAGKYGTTPEESRAARDRLTALGASLGFEFRYFDEMRTWNTSKAHQLLHWAGEAGDQTAFKLALFEAYFTRQEDVSDDEVLIATASRVGLDAEIAREVLRDGRYAALVRDATARFVQQGISGVPAFIVDRNWLVSGARETEVFASLFERLAGGEPAAASAC